MKHSHRWAAVALPGVLALTVGLGVTPTAHTTAQAVAPPAPHIMVIIDENAAYDSSLGSPYIVDNTKDAPYIHNTLIPTYTSATKWYSVEHVSSYDYYDLISGADQKGLSKPYLGTTFVDQLAAKGISWKAYIESMPSTCYTGGGNGVYDPGHNPFIAFKSIVKNPAQCNNDVPMTSMTTDLNKASPPSFVWVSPNQCDNMHSNCSPTNNKVTQGDTWLSTTIPAVKATNWYKNGGIIIVTWDESVVADTTHPSGTTDSGGHVATIVISAANNSPYSNPGDHFGTLRGLESAYGVACLVAACQAVHGDISGAFQATTGAITGTVTDSLTHAAINGATVSCTCSGTAATTDTSGAYNFSAIAPGNYNLSFSATGYTSQTSVPVLVTKGTTATRDAALVPQPGTISGTVTDQASVPLGGATVSCPTCTTTSTTTAPDGSYSFSSVPEGSYSLSFSDSGYVSQNNVPVTVTPGGTTTQNEALAQVGPGSITGTVTDQTTTNTISGATVGCSCSGTAATTDTTGKYTFSSVIQGSYTLNFSATGYTAQNGVPVSVTDGSTTTQNAALVPQPGTITGTVTDQTTTNPIPGATVSCPGCPITVATTDGSGVYTFSSVPEGGYSLSFSKTGYVSQNNVPVSVAPGGTTTQSAALSPTPPFVFSDGFESGFTPWTSESGLAIESTPISPHSGSNAAQGSVTSSAADARETLPSTYTTAYERVWFYLVSQSTQVYLLQANTSANVSVATVYVSSKGVLGFQAADGSRHDSTFTVTTNGWHELELRFTISGTSSSADLWLDGGSPALSLTGINLKTTQVGVMQIGDATSHTWNALFDDAAFDPSFIP